MTRPIFAALAIFLASPTQPARAFTSAARIGWAAPPNSSLNLPNPAPSVIFVTITYLLHPSGRDDRTDYVSGMVFPGDKEKRIRFIGPKGDCAIPLSWETATNTLHTGTFICSGASQPTIAALDMVAEREGDVADFQTKVSTLKGDVRTLSDANDALTRRINDLEAKLKDFETKPNKPDSAK
jgi:hypothetical protein